MNLRKKIIVWTLSIFILGLQGQSDAANLVGLNLLENVSIDKKDDALTVRFIFRDPVQSYKPAIFYKKSAQIDLPSTYIEPAKKYFETEDSQIPQVYLAQFDSKTVRARFMFTEDGESKKDGIHIETRGNTLTVRINKKETDFLSRLLAETAQTVEAAELEENQSPNTALTENVPATPEVVTQDHFNAKAITATNKVQPTPATVTKTRITKADDPSYFNLGQEGKALDETPSILKLFAMLAIVLSFMLGLFYIFKKYVLKNTPFGNGERLVKVLGTGFIAPRKHIALVEVAGQVLALGVSKDNISFLAEINNPEMIEKLKSNDSNNLAKQISNKFQKQKTSAPKASQTDSQPVKESAFNKYMQDFDDDKSDNKSNKEDSVAAVTRQIRRRMGKTRIA